jgi:hypothetical protein
MDLNTHDKRIDGDLYKVTMLPAKHGRKLLLELKTILGPTIAELLRGFGDDKKGEQTESLVDMDMSPIADAVAEFSQAVSPEKYQEVYTLFARHTSVEIGQDGTPDFRRIILNEQENHFQGRLLTEFKWMAYCLQVNYSDFLSGMESIKSVVGSAVAARMKPKSQSPVTSTGISGGSSQASATTQP